MNLVTIWKHSLGSMVLEYYFLGNKIEEIPWTAYQDDIRVRITLSKDDFDTVSIAALNHINSHIVKYNDLLVKVNNSTTINQVQLINW
jgi:hypothetical protein